MKREEIVEQLRALMQESLQEIVDWSTVTPESTIADLGFDSLSILDLIYDIQQGFEVEFEAEELTKVKTVGELTDFLQNCLSEKA